MIETTLCGHCQARPVRDRYVCPECATAHDRALWQIASLAGALDSKRAGERAIDYRGSSVSGTHEARLPYDERVTTLQRGLLIDLSNLARLATFEGPEGVGESWAPDSRSIASVALWLRAFTPWVSTREDGPAWVGIVSSDARTLERLFDGPAPTALVGLCLADREDGTRCPGALYVEVDQGGAPSSATVRCRECAAQHDVAERRGQMLDALDARLVTTREAAHHLAGIATRARITHTIRRHQLTVVGTRAEPTRHGEVRDVALYRLGDIRAALDTPRQERMTA